MTTISITPATPLHYTESGQERLDRVRAALEGRREYPPIVVVERRYGYDILDGHHRVTLAEETGGALRAVVLSAEEYEAIEEYGVLTAAYAALLVAGEQSAADDIAWQAGVTFHTQYAGAAVAALRAL